MDTGPAGVAARKELSRKLARREVEDVVHGENYSSATNQGRSLLSRFKELKACERADSENLGITLVRL